MTRTAPIITLCTLLLSGPAIADDTETVEGKPFETSVEMEAKYQNNACMANLGLEYFQKGDAVNVKSTVTNGDCAASSGSYTIRVRVRDDDGETSNIDFEETWARDDDADVVNEKDYPVGDSVDVLRVKGRKLRCECAAAADDATTDD